ALALGQEAEEGPKTGAELAPLLIGRLEADCAAFTADARAMSRDAGAAGEAMALATPDGAMVMLNSGEELGDYVLTRFFTETRLSTVRTVACGYSAYRPFGGMGDGGIDTGEDYYR